MIRLLTIAFGVFLSIATVRVALAQNAEGFFNDAEKESIRTEALNAILANPEIIREAMAILEAREANQALASVLSDPNTPILGNPDGEVTLIEFFDYNCGYCRRMADPLQDLLAEEDNLRIVMIETPILSQESYEATQVALGVNILGGYYSDLHFDAMTMGGRSSGDSLLDVARDLGVNVDVLRAVMSSDAVEDTISRNYEAMQSLEISGTPAFVVAGSASPTHLTDINIMRGAVPVEELRSAIEMLQVGS